MDPPLCGTAFISQNDFKERRNHSRTGDESNGEEASCPRPRHCKTRVSPGGSGCPRHDCGTPTALSCAGDGVYYAVAPDAYWHGSLRRRPLLGASILCSITIPRLLTSPPF